MSDRFFDFVMWVIGVALIAVVGFVVVLMFRDVSRKEPTPKDNEKTNNQDYPVQLLFESGGCKVYRFYDQNFYRYFTNCSGSTFSIETRLEGKISKTYQNEVSGGAKK